MLFLTHNQNLQLRRHSHLKTLFSFYVFCSSKALHREKGRFSKIQPALIWNNGSVGNIRFRSPDSVKKWVKTCSKGSVPSVKKAEGFDGFCQDLFQTVYLIATLDCEMEALNLSKTFSTGFIASYKTAFGTLFEYSVSISFPYHICWQHQNGNGTSLYDTKTKGGGRK